MTPVESVDVDEELEIRLRRLFDQIIASTHYFPEDFALAQVVDIMHAASDSDEARFRAGAPQCVGAIVAARLALTPYPGSRPGELPEGGAGESIATDVIRAAPAPMPWMVRPRQTSGIGIAVRPRTEDERSALIEAALHKWAQYVQLAADEGLDLCSAEGRILEGACPDMYLMFVHSLRTHLSGLEREARREPLPEWAIQAVKDAHAARSD